MGRIAKPDHIEVIVKIKHLKRVKRQQVVTLNPALPTGMFDWIIDMLEQTKIPNEPGAQDNLEQGQ